MAVGTRFQVTNTATEIVWGIVEVVEAQDTSCVCQVSDRINIEFWDEMELRMYRDASPPLGVTIPKEFPEGLLIEEVLHLVKQWGD